MRSSGLSSTLGLALGLALAGCGGVEAAPSVDAGGLVDARDVDGAVADGGGAPIDAAMPSVDGGMPTSGIAPTDAVPGETLVESGALPVHVPAGGEVVLRIDALPTEHVTFFASFTPTDADLELDVLRWDGADALPLGTTDAGRGLRTLAVFDPSGPRTFWARLRGTGTAAVDATLTITRVPFADGATCPSDCAHLLQLPLPNDPLVDGYDHTASTIFRYQYGRRDLVMFIRHAGQAMRAIGLAPFVPEDLSQWDGQTPGTDVGAPRHASHQRGKDVDLSLYGLDGQSMWRSYCTTEQTADGRECVAGTESGLDGVANARFFADFFATGRVTMCFLDRELHPTVFAGLDTAVSAGEIPVSLSGLFTDGVHIQHWPNHDNHIHVRVSEVAGSALTFGDLPAEPFEAP